MPRVYMKKSARKDYPEFGIQKGDTYYEWAFYKQKSIKSKTYPTRAQLTQVDYLAQAYRAYDNLPHEPTVDDLQDLADQLSEAADLASEARDNIPENLQNGERYYAIDDYVDGLMNAESEIRDIIERLNDKEDEYGPSDAYEEAINTEPEFQG